MQRHKNIQIQGSKGKPILVDVFYNPTSPRKPLVIFSHGFKGFKDWGHFDVVADRFAEAGFVFIKFNFSHNGTTPQDPLTFGDLEAFGNNNFTLELDDLKTVIDWALSYELIDEQIDRQRLFLLGHSRGGGITIIKAGEDLRVKKIATWAAVSDLVNRNKQRTIETWKKEGVVYAKNARTKQDMPLYYQFYEDQQANKERLNINHAVKRLKIPFLIVHGTDDKAVDYRDAEDLKRSAKHATLLSIAGADHTFGIKHPFMEVQLTAEAEEVLQKTISFFYT
jgi:uncharacterized protein